MPLDANGTTGVNFCQMPESPYRLCVGCGHDAHPKLCPSWSLGLKPVGLRFGLCGCDYGRTETYPLTPPQNHSVRVSDAEAEERGRRGG